MTKKKEKQQKAIGAENMLRFYDTELIERLNKRFTENGNRYENRNHFLTDLIEAGLNRREQEIYFKNKLVANETEMYKSMDAFSDRMLEFENYVRTQFKAIGASDYLSKVIMTATYNLAEAIALRKIIPSDSVKSGNFDVLPERFTKLEQTAKEAYMRNE